MLDGRVRALNLIGLTYRIKKKHQNEFFKQFQHKKSNERAEVEDPSNRRDKTAENVEIGVGIVGNKLHEPRVLESWEPRAKHSDQNHECVNEKKKSNAVNNIVHEISLTRLRIRKKAACRNRFEK